MSARRRSVNTAKRWFTSIPSSKVFENVSPETICWMSHNDYVETAPTGFTISAYTDNCPVAAVGDCRKRTSTAVQFHPEVLHTPEGKTDAAQLCLQRLRLQGRLEDGLLRGNESSRRCARRLATARCCAPCPAAWIPPWRQPCSSKAVGKQLTCVFVDHGLLRKNETEEVCSCLRPERPVRCSTSSASDARERFYDKLAGVTEPETKAQDHRRGVHPRL